MSDEATTYEEWRVTGDPGEGYPPYQFTWSPVNGHDDPEGSARGFLALLDSVHDLWRDGPHLHHRTVTATAWRAADERLSA